jgi:sugar/nucleoside kinase (ribokinase family)
MSLGVFFGLTGLDSVYYIDSFPNENTKVKTNEYKSYIGGSAANAAITYSLLGGEAILITYIGYSSIALSIKDELETLYGIKVYDCSSDKYELPAMSSISVNTKNGNRTILSGQPNIININFHTELKEIYAKADFFFTDSNLPELTLPIIKEVKSYAKTIVLDLGSWKPDSLKFLELSDEVIASNNCKYTDAGEIIFNLNKNINKAKIATTNGENEITYFENGITGLINPPEVIIKDTLAAGDIFHGAFCYFRFVKKNSFLHALEEASIIASESVKYIGPREGIKKYNIESKKSMKLSLKKLNYFNKQFEYNYCNGQKCDVITYCKKKQKIVFVSVHAINHYNGVKDNNLKYADLYTGGIVKMVEEKTKSSIIINQYRHQAINPYKGITNADKIIRSYNKFFKDIAIIDIHGAKNNNLFDVAIGTGGNINEEQLKMINIIKSLCKKYKLKMKINLYKYKARCNRTITKRCRNIGINRTLQIEFSYQSRRNKINNIINLLLQLYKRIK